MSLLALLLGAILASSGCQATAEREAQNAPLKLAVAIQAVPQSGLIAIAEDKGFFKENGVEVSIKGFPSGLSALEALCLGQAQLATAADVAFVGTLAGEPSLRIVASIGLATGTNIVARKDRNIREPMDLKGKKVGFSRNTVSDYTLDMFLLANAVPRAEVKTVNIPPARMVAAVESGEVDAASAFGVTVYEAKKRLGENAMIWDSQGNVEYHWVLAVKEGLTRSPELITRFLQALVKAEDYLLTQAHEAKGIVTRKFGLDPGFVEQIWDKTTMKVTLNQSLVTSLDSLAKWKMNREGKLGETPNFLNYIYTGALDKADPRAVTIFR